MSQWKRVLISKWLTWSVDKVGRYKWVVYSSPFSYFCYHFVLLRYISLYLSYTLFFGLRIALSQQHIMPVNIRLQSMWLSLLWTNRSISHKVPALMVPASARSLTLMLLLDIFKILFYLKMTKLQGKIMLFPKTIGNSPCEGQNLSHFRLSALARDTVTYSCLFT